MAKVEGGQEGLGGTSGGSLPHLHPSLSTGAGIFLKSRDAPSWWRVGVASLWKAGNCSASGKEKAGSTGEALFAIVSALGRAPPCS